jgi:hypothetical protein
VVPAQLETYASQPFHAQHAVTLESDSSHKLPALEDDHECGVRAGDRVEPPRAKERRGQRTAIDELVPRRRDVPERVADFGAEDVRVEA